MKEKDREEDQERRYALRKNKRARFGKEEQLITGSKNQIPKISQQFVKRN